MKRIRRLVFVIVSAFVLVLAACGGGSSSSGGSGSLDKAASPFAGEYGGFEVISISGPGGTFPVGTFPLSIAIDTAGRVVVTGVDYIPFIGTLGDPLHQLQPNEFIATAFVVLTFASDISCLPSTAGYIGAVQGGVITGTHSGEFLCTGRGKSATLHLGGPFHVRRGAPGVPPRSGIPGPGDRRKSPKHQKEQAIIEALEDLFTR
jgi:hypothetical protein